MNIALDEALVYLKDLEKQNFHGRVIIGLYGGACTSIKLDLSVDLEGVKKLSNVKEEDSGANAK